jgi:hypothetical protein
VESCEGGLRQEADKEEKPERRKSGEEQWNNTSRKVLQNWVLYFG